MCVCMCVCVYVRVRVCVCVCIIDIWKEILLCFLVIQCIPLVLSTVVKEWCTDLGDTQTQGHAHKASKHS